MSVWKCSSWHSLHHFLPHPIPYTYTHPIPSRLAFLFMVSAYTLEIKCLALLSNFNLVCFSSVSVWTLPLTTLSPANLRTFSGAACLSSGPCKWHTHQVPFGLLSKADCVKHTQCHRKKRPSPRRMVTRQGLPSAYKIKSQILNDYVPISLSRFRYSYFPTRHYT